MKIFHRYKVRKCLEALSAMREKGKAVSNPEALVRTVLINLPNNWFGRLSRRDLRGTYVDVLFVNAEDLLTVIDDCKIAIAGNKEIPASANPSSRTGSIVTLDQWLCTEDGYPIPPSAVWDMLEERLDGIDQQLDVVDNQAQRAYYGRHLSRVYNNTVNVMEALLRVAL